MCLTDAEYEKIKDLVLGAPIITLTISNYKLGNVLSSKFSGMFPDRLYEVSVAWPGKRNLSQVTFPTGAIHLDNFIKPFCDWMMQQNYSCIIEDYSLQNFTSIFVHNDGDVNVKFNEDNSFDMTCTVVNFKPVTIHVVPWVSGIDNVADMKRKLEELCKAKHMKDVEDGFEKVTMEEEEEEVAGTTTDTNETALYTFVSPDSIKNIVYVVTEGLSSGCRNTLDTFTQTREDNSKLTFKHPEGAQRKTLRKWLNNFVFFDARKVGDRVNNTYVNTRFIESILRGATPEGTCTRITLCMLPHPESMQSDYFYGILYADIFNSLIRDPCSFVDKLYLLQLLAKDSPKKRKHLKLTAKLLSRTDYEHVRKNIKSIMCLLVTHM